MYQHGSVWVPVTGTDVDVWVWHPIIAPISGSTMAQEHLKNDGWQHVDNASYPALPEILQAQLAPIVGVQTTGQKEPSFWARPSDIQHALEVPVVLAFSVPEEVRGAAGESMAFAQTVPPQWFGTLGLVVEDANRSAWTVNMYSLRQEEDAPIRDLRVRLRDALVALAGAAGWHRQSPALEIAMQPDGLEQLQRQYAGNNQNAQALFDELFLLGQAIRAQNDRIQNQPTWWETEWEGLHRMALDLTDAYYAEHQEAHQEKPQRKLPHVPRIFDDRGKTQIPSPMPVLAVVQALTHPSKEHPVILDQADLDKGKPAPISQWYSSPLTDGRPVFVNKTPQHQTTIHLQQPENGIVIGNTVVQNLWEQVSQYKDLDADVFLAMLAQFIRATPDEDGKVWITADQILDYRGIQKMHANDATHEHGVAHRREDLEEIARCVARQYSQWVQIRSWIVDDEEPAKSKAGKQRKRKTGKRLYTHNSRLIVTVEDIRMRELLPVDERIGAASFPIAWRYEMGTWLKPFLQGANRSVAWLCQMALEYDPYRSSGRNGSPGTSCSTCVSMRRAAAQSFARSVSSSRMWD